LFTCAFSDEDAWTSESTNVLILAGHQQAYFNEQYPVPVDASDAISITYTIAFVAKPAVSFEGESIEVEIGNGLKMKISNLPQEIYTRAEAGSSAQTVYFGASLVGTPNATAIMTVPIAIGKTGNKNNYTNTLPVNITFNVEGGKGFFAMVAMELEFASVDTIQVDFAQIVPQTAVINTNVHTVSLYSSRFYAPALNGLNFSPGFIKDSQNNLMQTVNSYKNIVADGQTITVGLVIPGNNTSAKKAGTYTIDYKLNDNPLTSKTVPVTAGFNNWPESNFCYYQMIESDPEWGDYTMPRLGDPIQVTINRDTEINIDITFVEQGAQHTVTFNPNGGTVSPIGRNVNHGAAVGTLPTPVRAGYTFTGWFTYATGGTQISASTVVSAAATYYAHWQKQNGEQYVVSFNSNGGSVVANKTVKDGQTVGTLPTPTRAYYAFDGWWSAKTGGTKITAATVVTAPVAYYAHWKVTTKPKTSAPATVTNSADFKAYVKVTASTKKTVKKKKSVTIKLTAYKNAEVKSIALDKAGKKLKLKVTKGKNIIKVKAGSKKGKVKITVTLKNGNKKVLTLTIK
jgi:uncharacterized repeat protein (TIGR02543 family)